MRKMKGRERNPCKPKNLKMNILPYYRLYIEYRYLNRNLVALVYQYTTGIILYNTVKQNRDEPFRHLMRQQRQSPQFSSN